MKTLDEIAVTYGTDKASVCQGHDYCRIYDQLFTTIRHDPIIMVELGVQGGASMRTWAEYFDHPEAKIIGIDNNPLMQQYLLPKVFTYVADQAEIPGELKPHRFDLVIDDASHICRKTIDSFYTWFPAVKDGGYYVVEDVTTSYDETYGGCGNPDHLPEDGYRITTMQFFRRLADEVNAYAKNPSSEHRIGFDLDWITFHPDLIVMKKAGGLNLSKSLRDDALT